ncbi:MAG: hypothetical protein FWJ90_11285 [Actinomadura sp.]
MADPGPGTSPTIEAVIARYSGLARMLAEAGDGLHAAIVRATEPTG